MTALLDSPARGGPGRSWAPATRIARRDARRHPARTALIFVLIGLPVLIVVLGAGLLRSMQLTAEESLPRQLGSTDASIQTVGEGPIMQCPDASCYRPLSERPTAPDGPTGPAAISSALGPGTRIIALPSQPVPRVLEQAAVLVTEAPLEDPALEGMAPLVEGRLPNGRGEVAVTPTMVEHGTGIGTTLDLGDYGTARVVGVVDSRREPLEAFALPGGLGVPFADDELGAWFSRWLVTTPGGVSWDEVLALNANGFTVLSRAVVLDPPSTEALLADPRTAELAAEMESGIPASALAMIALGVAMVLLEIALLAGPAFAVGAARQSRSLGMIAAQGGRPRDLRRVVLAQAVVVGGVAVVVGAAAGIVLSYLGYPLVVDATNGGAGPFQVAPGETAVIMAFGLVAAVAAAVMPARAVARLQPAAAIAGRRPQPRRLRWHSGAGLALIAVGAGLAAFGAARISSAGAGSAIALLFALGSVLAIVGAVLLAPLAVSTLARLSRRAPTSVRYALRDMGRSQLRTAPAVAAVTAVVAATVAVGIVTASDAARSAATYRPLGPFGDAVVNLYNDEDGGTASDAAWDAALDAVTAGLPGAARLQVPGLPDPVYGFPSGPQETLVLTSTDLLPAELADPNGAAGGVQLSHAGWSTYWFRAALVVGGDGLAAVSDRMTADQAQQAQQALAAGKVVVLSSWDGRAAGTVRLDKVTLNDAMLTTEPPWQGQARYDVPAIALRIDGVSAPALAVLPESIIAAAGVATGVVGALIDAPQDLTRADGERMQEQLEDSPELAAAGASGYLMVEAGLGYQPGLVLLILGLAAIVLALVGSVTASLLALSDARSDFATLGAVGAAPGVRRRIAGTYGFGIALLGAILGAAVGLIPGVAIAGPATQTSWGWGLPITEMTDLSGNPIPSSFLAVPWGLFAALLLVLPALVGLVLLVVTRSRLPLRQRLE